MQIENQFCSSDLKPILDHNVISFTWTGFKLSKERIMDRLSRVPMIPKSKSGKLPPWILNCKIKLHDKFLPQSSCYEKPPHQLQIHVSQIFIILWVLAGHISVAQCMGNVAPNSEERRIGGELSATLCPIQPARGSNPRYSAPTAISSLPRQ